MQDFQVFSLRTLNRIATNAWKHFTIKNNNRNIHESDYGQCRDFFLKKKE
jgi:hypothetical protein